MSSSNKEIRDDEFRVIGGHPSRTSSGNNRKSIIQLVVAVAVLTAGAFLLFVLPKKPDKPVPTIYEPEQAPPVAVSDEPVEWLGDYSDSTGVAFTERLQMSINDIPLTILIPHNAVPSLSIGTPDMNDRNIILVAQAADIRADNGKINGAFVLAGKPMAWGLSKKGFCGIIDGKVTVGVADNSPLFEEATEKGGYFFRQYPLVDNGALVENEPKNKSIRKAICDRAGEIMVVISETPESFHDFAQALVDLHVDNAIYLVGSDTSYGFWRGKDGKYMPLAEKRRGGQKYENYLKWEIE